MGKKEKWISLPKYFVYENAIWHEDDWENYIAETFLIPELEKRGVDIEALMQSVERSELYENLELKIRNREAEKCRPLTEKEWILLKERDGK